MKTKIEKLKFVNDIELLLCHLMCICLSYVYLLCLICICCTVCVLLFLL